MLLVVVILGIIAMMTLPNFGRSFTKLKLHETASNISYLMRYAQSRAITKSQSVQLTFDVSLSHYWLLQGPSLDEAEEMASGNFQEIPSRWGRKFEVPSDITIETTQSTVAFYPDGQIEKARINVCHENNCMIISSEGQRG